MIKTIIIPLSPFNNNFTLESQFIRNKLILNNFNNFISNLHAMISINENIFMNIFANHI